MKNLKVKKWRYVPNFVLHCFSSGKELAYKSLELGGFISLSGIVTFKNATELQSIVKTLPLDRIFLETDAPYLSPVPFRGKENQPANVYHIAKFLAELLNLDFSYICKRTTENAVGVFFGGVESNQPLFSNTKLQ